MSALQAHGLVENEGTRMYATWQEKPWTRREDSGRQPVPGEEGKEVQRPPEDVRTSA